MVTMFVIPASAATFEVTAGLGYLSLNSLMAELLNLAEADLQKYASYEELATALGYSTDAQAQAYVLPDGSGCFILKNVCESLVAKYNEAYPDSAIEIPQLYVYKNNRGDNFYRVNKTGIVTKVFNSNQAILTYSTTGKLVESVSENSFTGVLNQIIDLLPIIIPVIIGFIALRKGISFIQNTLHSA